jgi:monoterpene epsilon-lactone hydrolase
MPSLRSRLLLFIMKNRHLLRFRLKRENINWNTHASILRFREECEEGAKRFGKIPAGLEISPVTINSLSAEWIRPSHSAKEKVIFFLHGGGYVSGSCIDHRIHVAKFVKGTNIGALLFEYRLAPEHPFPAALDDSVSFAEKANAAGVDVTLRIGKGLFHYYPVCAPLFPEATQAMNEICEFIKNALNTQE